MSDGDERLRQVVRVSNIGIFEHDHRAETIYWSLELRNFYGWTADEPVTLPKILAHVHPDDAPIVGQAVRRAHDPAGDGLFDIEHRIIDRGGRLRWVQTRSQTYFGQVNGERRALTTIGAVQDVTERRSADDRLRVLDTVLSSSVQAIAIADARGILTLANAALCRLWGYSDSETLVGRSIFEFWKSAEPPALTVERIRAQRVQHVETLANRVDGSSFHLGVTAEAVTDSAGELRQVLVTFSDITDRKRLEAQLIQAQKMESIGRLAGGVAHDFNNMLTVISGGIELSLATLEPDQPSRAYLADAAKAAMSAATLTRQLLAFSRKGTIAPKVLDLNAVVRRMEGMVMRLLGEDIRLEIRCGAEVGSISFDPSQMEQVLLNLAVNARDAIVNGGRLTIETSSVLIPKQDGEGVGQPPGEYVLLQVSDNGVGMSEEVQAHLFEPFFTTKDAGKGTGLGLAMVYGAVQQNGGHIQVESAPGRGTTFRVYLPVVSASATPPGAAVHPPVPLSRQASILLVEDDARVAAFAKTVLEQVGHTVHSFLSGEDALAALASLKPPPALLVTDVVMPGVDGRELADRVRRQLPGIPVLFVSGYTRNVIAERGILPDGLEYLAKPYSAAELARRVREALEIASKAG